MAKHHMKSLAYKNSNHGLDGPDMPNYPVAYLDAEQMPEISTWEVGEEYTLKMVVKLRRRTETDGKISGDLELTSYETESEKSLD